MEYRYILVSTVDPRFSDDVMRYTDDELTEVFNEKELAALNRGEVVTRNPSGRTGGWVRYVDMVLAGRRIIDRK